MFSNNNNQKTVSPYLIISGLLLIVAGGITLHYAIFTLRMISFGNNAEILAGMITTYVGVFLMIGPLYEIGKIHSEKRNTIIIAIALLLLFIGADLTVSLVPQISVWGNTYGGFAVYFIYGLIRGFTFLKINKGLNIPNRSYGNWWLPILGWSHIATMSFSFMFQKIAVGLNSLNLAYISHFIFVGQIFIDAICFALIGAKFVIDAKNKPIIDKMEKTLKTDLTEEELEKHRIYDQSTSTEEPISSKSIRCSFCGAKNKGKRFCDDCGSTLG